jgi:hypothetical protein
MPDSAAWVLGLGSHKGEIPRQLVAFVVLLLSVIGYLVYREFFASQRGNS